MYYLPILISNTSYISTDQADAWYSWLTCRKACIISSRSQDAWGPSLAPPPAPAALSGTMPTILNAARKTTFIDSPIRNAQQRVGGIRYPELMQENIFLYY